MLGVIGDSAAFCLFFAQFWTNGNIFTLFVGQLSWLIIKWKKSIINGGRAVGVSNTNTQCPMLGLCLLINLIQYIFISAPNNDTLMLKYIEMAELFRSSGDLLWQFQLEGGCCCCNCDDYIGWWRGNNTHLTSRLNLIQPPQIRRGAALLCPAIWQIRS